MDVKNEISGKRKESGADGRKRRKVEKHESEKSSKFLKAFLEKSIENKSSSSVKSPSPDVVFSKSRESEKEEVDLSPKKCSSPEEEKLPENKISHTNDFEKLSSEIENLTQYHDIGHLKFDENSGRAIVTNATRLKIIKLGWKYFQNSDGPFLPTNNRSMTQNWFKKKLGDGRGEEVTRSWLVYSPFKKSAFCLCCILFSNSEHQSSLERESGFTQWKAPERIIIHENSKNHRENFSQWKEMELHFTRSEGFVDARILSQFEAEKLKWREILTRILHCIKFLATQNLALRGHRELHHTLDNSNVGNFLGLLKLVSVFDPVMKEHLRNVKSNPGSTSYLSPRIQNEFLHLMASAVRQRLLKSIHMAKYYGLMFDSTPDITHRDRMSEVVRFVDIDFEKKTVQVKETFLGFSEITVKNAKGLANTILEQLKKDEMNFQDCRSQCYDNAAVMAGHKNGVNEKLTEINRRALFVNCDNHSLNLVGVHAAKQNVTMVTFFGTIESLYAFFSRSTQRWKKLKEAIPVVMKSKSETRWSANVEAIKPVNNHLEKILEVLEEMTEDKNQTSETRSDAQQLNNRMLKYDFLILLGLWNKILIRIDRVQKRLQDPTMNFHDAAEDLKALQNYFENEREAIIDSSLEEGIILCQKWDVATERRRRRIKNMAGEISTDGGLSVMEEMKRVLKETVDRLFQEMSGRFVRLNEIDEKFGFLLDVKGLIYHEKVYDLKKKCNELGQFYVSDIDGNELYEEILDCRMLLTSRKNTILSPETLLEFIVQFGDESVFPNLRVAIQILLTIAVSIASCERSFSKLKLILFYLRATMGQERLCDLALLSIEKDETEKTDFDDLINEFASKKARKIQL